MEKEGEGNKTQAWSICQDGSGNSTYNKQSEVTASLCPGKSYYQTITLIWNKHHQMFSQILCNSEFCTMCFYSKNSAVTQHSMLITQTHPSQVKWCSEQSTASKKLDNINISCLLSSVILEKASTIFHHLLPSSKALPYSQVPGI